MTSRTRRVSRSLAGARPFARFTSALEPGERQALSALTCPSEIQGFLDGIPYSSDETYRCPVSVLRERKAHCFDGALFAAAALRRLGHPPRILYMTAVRDDDHLLAVYQRRGAWGAIAKSNFAGLRYREPIHRSLRELVMSYFESYFNVDGEKTLRRYTATIDLSKFDSLDWMTGDRNLERIADALDSLRTYRLLTEEMAAHLSPIDKRAYDAGLFGSDPAGLYDPSQKTEG